jgi:hypothetical protein
MPYHHPIAVTISVIWWGIYIGCLGASLSALVGLLRHAENVPIYLHAADRLDHAARQGHCLLGRGDEDTG